MRLDRTLVSRLRKHEVRVERIDPNTVVLRGVPTSPHFFNKQSTNLIFARNRDNEPFLVCVDEDLEYCGKDDAIARAFANGPRQAGWRAISLPGKTQDLPVAIEQALAALGLESEPCLPMNSGPADKGQGSRLDDLAAQPASDLWADDEITVGREREIHAVTSGLLKWGQARLVVIAGEPGIGKTNMARAVARKLQERDGTLRVVSMDVASVFTGQMFPADRESALETLLDEARSVPGTIPMLEHIDLVAEETGLGGLLLSKAIDSGLRVMGTALPGGLARLATGPLKRRMHAVRLHEPTVYETVEILRAIRQRLADYHGVDVDESCLRFCVATAETLQGNLPAKAIDLLDTACAMARLAETEVVGPDDICLAAASRSY